MVKIGDIKIDTKILLAPLAGCSDFSFRLICREHGARFCFFEMVDSNSLCHDNAETLDILKTSDKDKPIAAQLLGSEPAAMLIAAIKLLSIVKPSFIDINCACPAKKVIKKKAGSYLLHDTKKMSAIIKELSSSLPIPVTVKMRLGFYEDDIKHIDKTAKMCESSGAAALFVHGRTYRQGYAGDIDYEAIKIIKESVGIPVFASGNVFTPELAKKMFDMTACDGVCVARGALGNPWVFSQIENYIKCGKLPEPITTSEKKKVITRHLSYIEMYKNMRPSSKIGFMRKVIFWYLKNFPSAARIRERFNSIKTYDGFLAMIDKLYF